MCLNIQNKFSEPLVASEDLVVYKVLENTTTEDLYLTPFQQTAVSIGSGRTYKSKLSFDRYGDVERGLHSFCDLEDARALARIRANIFHQCRFSVCRCLIPKGSKYYVGWFNFNDSLASDKLTYVEVLETF